MKERELVDLLEQYFIIGADADQIYKNLSKKIDQNTLDTIWSIPRRNINNFINNCINNTELSPPFLDVGCGRRSLKPIIQEKFGRQTTFVGIDHYINYTEVVDTNGLPDIQAKAERLPFVNDVFNTIFCMELLEHVPDEKLLVSEMNRVLLPEGKLILSVPGVDFPKHEKLPFQRDYRRFNINELDKLLRSNGFDNIDISEVRFHRWQINIFSIATKQS